MHSQLMSLLSNFISTVCGRSPGAPCVSAGAFRNRRRPPPSPKRVLVRVRARRAVGPTRRSSAVASAPPTTCHHNPAHTRAHVHVALRRRRACALVLALWRNTACFVWRCCVTPLLCLSFLTWRCSSCFVQRVRLCLCLSRTFHSFQKSLSQLSLSLSPSLLVVLAAQLSLSLSLFVLLAAQLSLSLSLSLSFSQLSLLSLSLLLAARLTTGAAWSLPLPPISARFRNVAANAAALTSTFVT